MNTTRFRRGSKPAFVSRRFGFAALALFSGLAIHPQHPLHGGQAPASVPGEDVPPVKEFPKDLARNFVNLWSGDNLPALLVGSGLATAVIPADDRVTDYFRDTSRWQGFDGVGREIGKSQFLGPAIGLSFLASRMTDNVDYQRFTYSLAQGFLITNALTGGLKAVTRRERPDKASHLSFPSGHTFNSFLWATVVSRHYGW